MEGPKYKAYDVLISQTRIPEHMKKLRLIGVKDLVVGGHYLRFDGSLIRRIKAIEGDQIHAQDGWGVMVFEVEDFLKLHTAVAPPGSQVVPEDLDVLEREVLARHRNQRENERESGPPRRHFFHSRFCARQ
jgi:hypothetical protein